MSIKIETTCDGCQKQLEEGNMVYCRDCYLELEKMVNELEHKISRLEADLRLALII
ncbi:MAG: hypothetical protein JRJ57_13325 [Deltaproteobacteria bacterium]|nr:hypothetical protein [Deltaproteobacteria bacterium]